MIKKLSFISFGSFAMLFCMLISVATFAGDKHKKAKAAKAALETVVQQNISIAELYLNMNYTYVPVNSNTTLQLQNGQLPTANQQNVFMISKDDYHYYFQKNAKSFQFLYALKDNSIPLFDGFEYANSVKIPIGTQLFTFDLVNGRPVDMSTEILNFDNNNNVANTEIILP